MMNKKLKKYKTIINVVVIFVVLILILTWIVVADRLNIGFSFTTEVFLILSIVFAACVYHFVSGPESISEKKNKKEVKTGED